jgi:hypothetical protein
VAKVESNSPKRKDAHNGGGMVAALTTPMMATHVGEVKKKRTEKQEFLFIIFVLVVSCDLTFFPLQLLLPLHFPPIPSPAFFYYLFLLLFFW